VSSIAEYIGQVPHAGLLFILVTSVRITDRPGRAYETVTPQAMKNATNVSSSNLRRKVKADIKSSPRGRFEQDHVSKALRSCCSACWLVEEEAIG
jgi:hypothetical protein